MRIPEATTQFANFTQRRVGLEFENPLVHEDGSPVTAGVIQEMYTRLKQKNYLGEVEKLSGNVLYVEKPIGQGIVNVSTDCAWSSVELALPPADTLGEAETVYLQVRDEVLGSLPPQLRWLALGTVPGKFSPDPIYKTTKPIYRLVPDEYYHNIFLALNAHQVGISVRLNEATTLINELTKVSGLVVALCANSSIQNFSVLPWEEWRLVAWKFLLLTNKQGTSQLAGFPDKPFLSIADYYSYFWRIKATPFAAPVRDGAFISIPPISWFEYFQKASCEGQDLQGNKQTLYPLPQDLNVAGITHWPFAKLHIVFDPEKIVLADFFDSLQSNSLEDYLVDRYTNMYIEFRPIAAAPKGEELAMPALMLGLAENVEELQNFTSAYTWEEWKNLVDHAAVAGMNARLGKNPCYELLKPLIDIAFRGLRKRNCKEENYLVPLYDRIEKKESPAMVVNKILERQGREAFLNAITYDRP